MDTIGLDDNRGHEALDEFRKMILSFAQGYGLVFYLINI